MKDKNAGKYQRFYRNEFNLARSILQHENGKLQWSKQDYVAFTFRNESVSILFYPHKTTAGNFHLRVRDQNSKNPEEARRIMKKLYKGAGYNSTFTEKLSYAKGAKQ